MTFESKVPTKLYEATFNGVAIETAFSFGYNTNPSMQDSRQGDSVEPDQVTCQTQSPVMTLFCKEVNQTPLTTGAKANLIFKLKDSATSPASKTVTVNNCVVGAQGDALPGHGPEGTRQIQFHITKGNLPTYT